MVDRLPMLSARSRHFAGGVVGRLELVALNVADTVFTEDGLTVTIADQKVLIRK